MGSDGYAFQVEMTFRTVQAAWRMFEVPITFTDRRFGRSKMTLGIIVESAVGPRRLGSAARAAQVRPVGQRRVGAAVDIPPRCMDRA